MNKRVCWWMLPVAALVLSGCGRDVNHAKSGLLKLNYTFSTEDFIRAAGAGDEKAVKLFLDAGMDPSAETTSGNTALIGAAENNAPAIIQILTARGVDFGHKDSEGWTAFMKAVYADKLASVTALAPDAKEELTNGLLLASLLGHTEIVQVLLQAGAEVDTASEDGMTPLMYAAKTGNAALVSLLLQANADPAMLDKTGATAADYATSSGSTAVLALLPHPPTAATSTPMPTLAPTAAPALAAITPDATPIATLMPEVSPVPSSSATPAPEIAQATRKIVQTHDHPSAEEAWWKKYGLDANSPKVIQGDADKDHFNNAEEFLADTSPIDPTSHPAYASKLQWLDFHKEVLPFLLLSVKDGTATLKAVDGREVQVREGGQAGDWKVVKVTAAIELDKDGNPFNAAKVLLQNAAGDTIRLVPGIASHSAGSYARVKLSFADDILQLHQNDQFVLPGDPDRRYQVLDLRADQVVIKELISGQTFTVNQ